MSVSGKKKLIMALSAIAVALVNTFIANPQDAQTINQLIIQYIPTIVSALLAFFGINREARLDFEREKTKQLDITNTSDVKSEVESIKQEIKLITSSQYEPFNPNEFAGENLSKLQEKAKVVYTVNNPITVYYAALDKARFTPCRHINQALGFWDFALLLANKAFEWLFGFPYSEAEKHLKDDNPGCPYYSVDNMARQKGIEYWNMLLELRRTENTVRNLEYAQANNIDIFANLPTSRHTLYDVGESSKQIIEKYKGVSA